MSTRKSLSKKLRFEVFKRDKFTCQYCGDKAPDAILHVDHIDPVDNGGGNDILNLITSCEGCNLGKGARLLSDTATLEKQHDEIQALAERREQIEMMLEWRKELSNVDELEIDLICDVIGEHCNEFTVNDTGRALIKRWLKKYSHQELIAAVEGSFNSYHKCEEPDLNAHSEAWCKAFDYIPRVASVNRRGGYSDNERRMFYIRGILRNRVYVNERMFITIMKEAISKNVSLDQVESLAKSCRNWTSFRESLDHFNQSNDVYGGPE